jgi:signal transduction histidine kinase
MMDVPERNVLTKTEKRNLLLIAKEAINNSIKYSDCRNITVECKEVNSRVSFIIRDDGKGFDSQQPSSGNGLRNIAERASQIHYRCKIASAPGEGVQILLVKK